MTPGRSGGPVAASEPSPLDGPQAHDQRNQGSAEGVDPATNRDVGVPPVLTPTHAFPAKKQDGRFKKYQATTGLDIGWEVDGLPPRVLRALVRDGVDDLFDREIDLEVRAEAQAARDRLRAALGGAA